MLRNHCFTERFRSQVCDVFFDSDSAHSQSLRSDLVLYPQVRHICVLQLPDSLSVENVLSGFCVNGQHWLHCKAQVTHHALDPASLQTLPMLLHTVLPLRYFCIDLLPSCVCFQGVSSQHRHACARRLSSLLATDPVRVREHGQLFSQLPIFKHLSPVSLTFLVPGKPFQLGKALLIGTRHLSAQLVYDECYVCSVLATCDLYL